MTKQEIKECELTILNLFAEYDATSEKAIQILKILKYNIAISGE